MKISVVTIVWNDVSHIERTLRSVIDQTAYSHIEYIVVDGASTDGTSEKIKRYADKISNYICEPDSGIYNAMNKGLAASSGDYVIFMNSGDIFSSSTVIAEIMKVIGENHPDLVYGHYRETKNDGSIGCVIPCRKADKIWYGPVASHQSMFYRLGHLIERGINYDETLKIAADYKLSAEAFKYATSVMKTDICISDFDVSGVSSINQDQGLKEANIVRREVFGWGRLRILTLTYILLLARYTKRFAYPIYSIIRHRHKLNGFIRL